MTKIDPEDLTTPAGIIDVADELQQDPEIELLGEEVRDAGRRGNLDGWSDGKDQLRELIESRLGNLKPPQALWDKMEAWLTLEWDMGADETGAWDYFNAMHRPGP